MKQKIEHAVWSEENGLIIITNVGKIYQRLVVRDLDSDGDSASWCEWHSCDLPEIEIPTGDDE